MSRASPHIPNPNRKSKNRPPLPDALKKGVVALHNYEKRESNRGNRGRFFAVDTKISYGLTFKGKTVRRILIYVTYARTKKDKLRVSKEIAEAKKSTFPLHLHIGKLDGAFWFLASLSKKAIEKWGSALKTGFFLSFFLYLLYLVIEHPEVKPLVEIILKHPQILK